MKQFPVTFDTKGNAYTYYANGNINANKVRFINMLEELIAENHMKKLWIVTKRLQ